MPCVTIIIVVSLIQMGQKLRCQAHRVRRLQHLKPSRGSVIVQAHMGRLELPITDYVGDTKSALDNSVRILQAITDVAADAGWLGTTLASMRLIQGLMQVMLRPLSSLNACQMSSIVS